MIGELNATEIEEVLQRQVIGRIGCSDAGLTYVVPVSYAYDGSYVYGHGREGLKLAMMRKNPSVCFEVEEMKDMANWKSVICQGTFEELKDEQARRAALQKLVDRILPLISSETTHLGPHWPFSSEDIGVIKGNVFRIRLIQKTGRFESNVVTSFAVPE